MSVSFDTQLIPLTELGEVREEDVVVFGGTFDPFHSGHVTVVRSLLRAFQRTIIAPTVGNPWKNPPAASLEDRLKMIELVLEAEEIPHRSRLDGTGAILLDRPYQYSEEIVEHLRPLISGHLYWAVAEDIANEVSGWRNWQSHGVPTIICPVTIKQHATEIRAGITPAHPALQTFLRDRGLYGTGKGN